MDNIILPACQQFVVKFIFTQQQLLYELQLD